ncbi:tyrosinase family protein [Kitasatospora sp. A2-31]|uniref:tyrosinase family protein n=1 Tax=Kitasatospora sp. A2-31 TaxID=2916414 RepID=UPI001EEB6FD5|nr:tyrosinase family protein [Kitasatospora sp. A2-31]MCG6493856.1 tyrosinase family protein [Kitasatospora sp. A2-31]
MTKNRRDINSLSQTELDDYIHAIGILRARSAADPDDPTGYDFQAALHNDMFVGPCEHGSDLFLPWHRSHLYHFEKLLQESDPPRTADVTLPYWDWLHPEPTGKFPPAFALPGLAAERNEVATDLPPDTLEIVTQETDQGAFGGYPAAHPGGDYGRLELGPHNYMHGVFIGGAMGDPSTAAQDAIYFSFHTFIDLLWAEWQRRNGAPPLTSPDHDLRGFLSQAKHKVADFADTVALGYEYEYTDRLKSAFAVPVPAPVERTLLATRPLSLVSAPDFATQMREASRAQFGLVAAPEEGREAVVRLDELKIPLTGSYLLHAYVHPRDVPFRADDAEFADRYGVGYAVLWRAHAGPADGGHEHEAGHDHGGRQPHPHHPSSCTVRFDVTAVLAEAPEALGTHVLTLQYSPAPTGTGQPQRPPELVQEVALKDVVMEVYG